ncbi:MAG TPA: hypothetical protein PKE30_17600 [Niabella sp.]|nr:hypothetical protein [Niabella sp.]
MSSLKKIYDLEVTPPAGVWTNIARELDEINTYKNLSTHINKLEVTPPANIWAHIERELDESKEYKNLSEKIGPLEIIPPGSAWNRIAAALEETEQEGSLADRLYEIQAEAPAMAWENISKELDDQRALEIIERKLSNLQVTPPAAVWNNISRELNGKNTHQPLIVPMHHGWLKYAAAACFIAIISVTAFFILNDGSSTGTDYTAGTASGKPAPLNVQKTAQPTANTQQAPGNSRHQVLAEIKTKLGNAYSVSMERNTELQNRYIILMTQDGNVVRMSKKVSNMADCIAGEDQSCDDQISKWQKEMAGSNTTSSPDNFLDILDMASEEAANSNTNL